ncbi:hypothetical protein PG990_003693 [Apiospora arundinis]
MIRDGLTHSLYACRSFVFQALLEQLLAGIQDGKLFLDSGILDHILVIQKRAVLGQSRGLRRTAVSQGKRVEVSCDSLSFLLFGLLGTVRHGGQGDLGLVVRHKSVKGTDSSLLVRIVGSEGRFGVDVFTDTVNPPVHGLRKASPGLRKLFVLREMLGAICQTGQAIVGDQPGGAPDVLSTNVWLLKPSLRDDAPDMSNAGVVAQSAYKFDENFHAALHNLALRPMLSHEDRGWANNKIIREMFSSTREDELGVEVRRVLRQDVDIIHGA